MKKERSKKFRRLQIARIAVQTAFLGLFFLLLFGAHFTGEDYIGRVEAFFHFDPLLAAATILASRVFLVYFAWAALTVLVTVLFGRIVCGWICPLGTVHQLFSWIFKKARFLRPKKPASGGLWIKYAVLAFVLVAALFGLNAAGYLDPLSFLTRASAAG
ncbi:MAG TPA: 4Fe-4S binding protein, partial [Candidatus Aminicenantes bacterium]|nr:4Fe-4S binding protein [Candidatus Aminicenantes bacterium]